MLELDPRAVAVLRREAHLDLGVEIRIEAEVGVQLPVEYDALRRLPGEHLAPVALAAVLATLEPAPPVRGSTTAVTIGAVPILCVAIGHHALIPAVKTSNVRSSGARTTTLWRTADCPRPAQPSSFSFCSAASRNAASDWSQNESKYARRSATACGSTW